MLYTKTAERLLQVMLQNPLHEYKEIEIIKIAKTGKGAANTSIKKLVKDCILREHRVGRSKLISLNIIASSIFFLKNLFNEEKLRRLTHSKLASILLFKDRVKDYADLLVIFGSCVAGTATEKSDIDVLVVSTQLDKINIERKKIEGLFGERFNIHSYSKKDVEQKIKDDLFIQNALFQGVLVCGFDFGQRLFFVFGVHKDLERLFFLSERIKSAFRNYLNKDYDASKEIIEQVLEQLTYYLLSEKKISYASKKNALDAIKRLPEGILIRKINKAHIKKKIILSEELVLKIVTNSILKSEGYD